MKRSGGGGGGGGASGFAGSAKVHLAKAGGLLLRVAVAAAVGAVLFLLVSRMSPIAAEKIKLSAQMVQQFAKNFSQPGLRELSVGGLCGAALSLFWSAVKKP